MPHVFQIGAIILTHEEKLPGVSEYRGPNLAFFEAAVLLNNRNVPAIELAHLRVTLLYDLFAAWNIQKPRDFLVHVPLSQAARHRDDVLPRVIGDKKSGDCTQQLRRFGNVTEFEMRDLAG